MRRVRVPEHSRRWPSGSPRRPRYVIRVRKRAGRKGFLMRDDAGVTPDVDAAGKFFPGEVTELTDTLRSLGYYVEVWQRVE